MARRLTQGQIDEIERLAKAGRSIRDISRSLHISKTTVYYHARKYCRKMTKLDLTLLSELEKGYIAGVFLGDGDINRGRKTQRYIVRFSLDRRRDQDISARLHEIFRKGGKKVSIFPRDATLIVKVCSKELVNYIQTHIEYRRNPDNQTEKTLLTSEDWSQRFQYGILAGVIDSDGHVHKHLGTEVKTVSSTVFRDVLRILTNLGIKAKTKIRQATEESYSKKQRYVMYIPSAQMKANKRKIPSAKVARFL